MELDAGKPDHTYRAFGGVDSKLRRCAATTELLRFEKNDANFSQHCGRIGTTLREKEIRHRIFWIKHDFLVGFWA